MSGIFGIFRRDGALVSARDLDRISAAMRHRAIDGGQTEVLGMAGLGHVLTRVTHEDLFEAQPLHELGEQHPARCARAGRSQFGLGAGDAARARRLYDGAICRMVSPR